jgi:predicted RNA-binding Zn ribbon-like protein
MSAKKNYLMLADHPALDLLNTVLTEDGSVTDLLKDDDDVSSWLRQAGFAWKTEQPLKVGRLLTAAKNLREAILSSVKERKAARPVHTEALNRFLACSRKYTVLIQHRGQPPVLETRIAAQNEMELLAPIAEQAADLLAHENFNLVRQCEHESCILWFLDTTKAHRRRWCSMATCGNRSKAEAFRRRIKAEASA